MFTLEAVIEYWKAKNRNRTAGVASSPDPWIQATIRHLQDLKKLQKGDKTDQ